MDSLRPSPERLLSPPPPPAPPRSSLSTEISGCSPADPGSPPWVTRSPPVGGSRSKVQRKEPKRRVRAARKDRPDDGSAWVSRERTARAGRPIEIKHLPAIRDYSPEERPRPRLRARDI